MARYIGPKTKIAKRFKSPIYGYDKYLDRKNRSQDRNSTKKRSFKVSEYGLQLKEKQKAKYTYGVLERQFKNVFRRASSKKGVTGEILLQLMEARLDNVVYRMGIAPTRAGARQLVLHKHITVNNAVVNIPSYSIKPNDIVSVRERSKSLEVIVNSLSTRSVSAYPWLEWDLNTMTGKFMQYPEREMIPEEINEQLIVELYSK
ncbi:MAG: 30S ribosomal protein S4 [Bacteroidales bacterium]|jgi:small subunit ribosomal protein S4|nr:30S ribosomal protein S4 [Bacteroidales bacterium]